MNNLKKKRILQRFNARGNITRAASVTQDDFFCIAFSPDDNSELTQDTRATPTLLVKVPNVTGLREGEVEDKTIHHAAATNVTTSIALTIVQPTTILSMTH